MTFTFKGSFASHKIMYSVAQWHRNSRDDLFIADGNEGE